MLSLPAFQEAVYDKHRENKTAEVIHLPDAEPASFDAYVKHFQALGFALKESYTQGNHRYAALKLDSTGVFLNYFAAIRELYIAVDEDCHYFSYTDTAGTPRVAPQITQVRLENYGLSYVIRLSDGRFIVIDGGWNLEVDQDRLFACLKEGSPDETPVIAAWILSHPHADHYHCFLGFFDRYATQVKIEKFMLLFPEPDDFVHYPKFEQRTFHFGYETSEIIMVPELWDRIARSGAEVYTPHTGQHYQIGDASCQILACMDDTIHCSQKVNAISLVIRMELGGEVILWATDASFDFAKLPEKYGSYLKADILQVPHHGFQCGAAEAEIRGYDLVRPEVCFMPVSVYDAFYMFCIHRDGTRHLLRDCNIKELIVGEPQRTIELPYTPKPYAKAEIERAVNSGMDAAGAETWIYTDLNTACPEDFQFTLLNTTNTPATVSISLYFEQKAHRISNVPMVVSPLSFQKIDLLLGDEEADKPGVLKNRELPENALFAIRFLSNIPIVVSHKTHTPAHCSNNHR